MRSGDRLSLSLDEKPLWMEAFFPEGLFLFLQKGGEERKCSVTCAVAH